MENEDHLDAVFHALSDRRRRALLAELAEGAKPISVLAEVTGMKISATSKHIAKLEQADLLFKSRRGREVFCHMNFDVWRVAAGYISLHAKFWSGRLNELEAYLKKAGVE